jgi:hypothetical protein
MTLRSRQDRMPLPGSGPAAATAYHSGRLRLLCAIDLASDAGHTRPGATNDDMVYGIATLARVDMKNPGHEVRGYEYLD